DPAQEKRVVLLRNGRRGGAEGVHRSRRRGEIVGVPDALAAGGSEEDAAEMRVVAGSLDIDVIEGAGGDENGLGSVHIESAAERVGSEGLGAGLRPAVHDGQGVRFIAEKEAKLELLVQRAKM